MRNLKKFLALVLAMLMIVSASAVVSASDFSDVADDSIYAEAIADLVEKEIAQGVGGDLFNPDGPVERYQMALFIARSLEPDVEEETWQNGMQVFNDVDEYFGVVAWARANDIIRGITDTEFAPHAGIRYQDALIMALRALGYTVDQNCEPYWLNAYYQAQELGLTKNLSISDGSHELTRAETAQVIYNMINATPADGGATIAANNFGDGDPDNVTTFIITATPKQYYSEAYDDVTDTYVGLQELVNGLPAGDIIYRKASTLGIDEDEVENYFGYSFGFVNYDRDTKDYDAIRPGTAPTVVYSTDVEYTSNNSKLKIDGITYTPVEEIENQEIYNEIIVLNSGSLATAKKQLATNKDGDVVNGAKEVVAEYILVGNDVCYYDLETDEIITKAEAEIKYGVDVDGASYDIYSTLTAQIVKDTANYQLTLFDDDGDNKFERAIVAPVYVSVYKAVDSGKETFGPMQGKEGVVYTDDAAKTSGTVFTYTYNAQTNTVNVIDILESEIAMITKVNTTDSSNGNIKVTIGGEEYTLRSANNRGNVGATVTDGGEFDFGNGHGKQTLGLDKFTKWEDLGLGYTVEFYEINDYIIYAENVTDLSKEKPLAYVKTVNWDGSAVYADIYYDGKLIKNATISRYKGKDLDDLNIVEFTQTVNSLLKIENTIVAAYEDNGKFQIREVEANEYGTAFGYVQVNATSGSEFYFDDGIADKYYVGSTLTDVKKDNDGMKKVLRANNDTVFYFVSEDEIYTYVGKADKSSIDFKLADVYSDKVGYTGDYAGVSSVIIVDCGKNDIADVISGFDYTASAYTVVYVATADVAEYASADDIGVTGNGYYYSYNIKGIDMQDGTKLDKIYSANRISAGKFYTINNENVVLSEYTTIDKSATKLGQNDFVQYREYAPINGVIEAGTVETIGLVKSDGNDIKFDQDARGLLGNESYTIAFVKAFNTDGSFIGIIMLDESASGEKGNVNAQWTGKNGTDKFAANATTVSTTEAQIKVDAYVYSNNNSPVEFTGYGANVAFDAKWDSMTEANVGDIKEVKIYKNSVSQDNLIDGTWDAKVSYSDGVATITIDSVVDPSAIFGEAYKFVSGSNYVVQVEFDTVNYAIEFGVTID